MFSVYCHQNKINGMRYIGVTNRTLEERAERNAEGYRSTKAFYQAIQEFGWDNFSHEVLATFENREDAMNAEKQYIEKYATRDPRYGYNRQCGGYPHSDDNAVAHEAERVESIKQTLHEQRSTPEMRAVMSDRMQKVWDDPERRARIVAARSTKKKGGRPHLSAIIVELDKEFETASELSSFLRCSKNVLWARLRKHSEFTFTATPDGYDHPVTFTIRRLNRGA